MAGAENNAVKATKLESALLKVFCISLPLVSAYGIYREPLSSFGPAFSVVFLSVVAQLLVGIFNGIMGGHKRITVGDIFFWVFANLLLLLFAVVIVGAYYGSFLIPDLILSWGGSAAGASVSLALLLGLSLFYLRLRFRCVYGASEVCVGAILANNRFDGWKIVGTLSDRDLLFAFLTAAVYLIVRGLDNIHQGLVREPLDPIGEAIFHWLFKEYR